MVAARHGEGPPCSEVMKVMYLSVLHTWAMNFVLEECLVNLCGFPRVMITIMVSVRVRTFTMVAPRYGGP